MLIAFAPVAAAADQPAAPGTDFYTYVNGAWISTTPIPVGTSKVDTTSLLRQKNAKRVLEIVEEVANETTQGRSASPDDRKVANFFLSQGLAASAGDTLSLATDLAAIAAIDDRRGLAAWLGNTIRLDDGANTATESLWGLWVHQDLHRPERYAAHLVQGGLGLATPERYLDAGSGAAAERDAYRAHVALMLAGAGRDRPAERAAGVVALETKIARTHASRADTDDPFKIDNIWQRKEFEDLAPGFDWSTYFVASGLDRVTSMVVWQPGAVRGGAQLLATEPLDVWKDYLIYHLIEHDAPTLPRTPEAAVAATEATFGDAIGRSYVERFWPPAARDAARAMVENIRAAMRTHLARIVWMEPATRRKALAKLAALRIGLGYPDHSIDYARLVVTPDDGEGNVRRAERFALRTELSKIGQPVEPGRWPAGLYPQTVGAILEISPNAMEFAAGLLQPPFFDWAGDAAAAYGSAGAGIAHEMLHSFDELGNLYDGQGRLGLWWGKEDVTSYRKASTALVAQLNTCSPAPGLLTHGKQVLAESAVDLGGVSIAYDAYHRSLHGRSDVIKDGRSGDQRFFIAFAERWRAVQTDAARSIQVATDSHAPPRCRANLVRNLGQWIAAFGIRSGDPLYLRPEARVHIW